MEHQINGPVFIKQKVSEYIINDKKDNGYWSLKEICLKIGERYGVMAAVDAREIILKEVVGIEDEEKYINNSLCSAKKQKQMRRMTNQNKKLDVFENI